MKNRFIPVAMAALMTHSIEGMAKSAPYCTEKQTAVSCAVLEPKDSISSVEKFVKETVARHLKIDKKKVLLKSNLIRDLGADSLDIVEIVMNLEKKYSFEFTDDELEKLKTVGDLVSVIVIGKRKKVIVNNRK